MIPRACWNRRWRAWGRGSLRTHAPSGYPSGATTHTENQSNHTDPVRFFLHVSSFPGTKKVILSCELVGLLNL
jgi:hypothetical protein